jgi:hypothetical protein
VTLNELVFANLLAVLDSLSSVIDRFVDAVFYYA